jgi:hypothetical protein
VYVAVIIIRHPPIVCISKAALLKRIGKKEGGNERERENSRIRRMICIVFHGVETQPRFHFVRHQKDAGGVQSLRLA